MSTPDDPYATPAEGSVPPPPNPAAEPQFPPPYGQTQTPPVRPPAAPAAGYGQPTYGQPDRGAPGDSAAPVGTNGLAIASLILGFVGLVTCGIGSVVGIILGFVGLSQIKKSGQQGRGLAISGVVIGFVVIAIGIAAAAVVIAFGRTLSDPCSYANYPNYPNSHDYQNCINNN